MDPFASLFFSFRQSVKTYLYTKLFFILDVFYVFCHSIHTEN